MIRRIFLLLPFLASGVAAQGGLDAEPVEVRRYTVEMIVFAYAQNVSADSEIFVAGPPPFEELLAEGELDEDYPAETLGSQPSVAAPEPEIDVVTPYEIVILDSDDFTLDEVYGHLRRLDTYEPLLHFGWTQATSPEQKDEPRLLSSFVSPPIELNGDVNLYLSRYLHLAVNFQFDAPIDNRPEARRSVELEQNSLLRSVRYRIEEDRIFRNGELRYFDHPKFGVLAKISRVEGEDQLLDEELIGD